MDDANFDDQQVIVQLQAGDLDALGILYDRYQHQVFRTALAITHDKSAAEDILQECFIRVHRYAASIDPERPFSPWLYRVAINLSYTWTKRNKQLGISIDDFVDRLVSAPKHAPERYAERSELRASIQQAIDNLPFGQRVVIVLHYLNGQSLKEIAQTLDCPVGTVKSRLYHARANLREQLGNVNWVTDIVHGYT
ncbi:MAG: RNA polymerase sigma factor [Chloroflexi bacterium]|nr:RNA polymerase sigma factor [Chloroflexota bacterium]